MAIPSSMQFVGPLLRYLAANPNGGKMADVCVAVADVVGLTDEDRNVLKPNGGAVFRNRIAWAQFFLRDAGFTCAPIRGKWSVTPAGLEYAASHVEISYEEIKPATVRPKKVRRSTGQVRAEREARYADVLRLHEQGLGVSEIAKKLGMSTSTVTDIRHRLGVGTPSATARIVEDIGHAVSASATALAIRLESLTQQIEATGLVADEKEIKQWIRDLSTLGKTAKAMRIALSQRLLGP